MDIHFNAVSQHNLLDMPVPFLSDFSLSSSLHLHALYMTVLYVYTRIYI